MTSAMDTDTHEKAKTSTAVPYINVTPLIDVLLVLLIIFMVVTPLKPSRFKADIPTQRDPNEDLSKLKPNPLTLVVSISPDLQIKLNQDPLGSVNDTTRRTATGATQLRMSADSLAAHALRLGAVLRGFKGRERTLAIA